MQQGLTSPRSLTASCCSNILSDPGLGKQLGRQEGGNDLKTGKLLPLCFKILDALACHCLNPPPNLLSLSIEFALYCDGRALSFLQQLHQLLPEELSSLPSPPCWLSSLLPRLLSYSHIMALASSIQRSPSCHLPSTFPLTLVFHIQHFKLFYPCFPTIRHPFSTKCNNSVTLTAMWTPNHQFLLPEPGVLSISSSSGSQKCSHALTKPR